MRSIGVIDSGIGGYSVAKAIHESSKVNIVFLADQKNMPYGNRSKEDLLGIMKNNIAWFQTMGIDEVLIACNTASTVAPQLQEAFPDMKIHGLIDYTVEQLRDTTYEELLVLGTKATIESGQYQEKLKKCLPNTTITAIKCPELAELVELGNLNDIEKYIESQLQDYENTEVPLLLACTHYSIVHAIITDFVGGVYYDSEAAIVPMFQDYEGEETFVAYTSGSSEQLRSQLEVIFHDTDKEIRKQD